MTTVRNDAKVWTSDECVVSRFASVWGFGGGRSAMLDSVLPANAHTPLLHRPLDVEPDFRISVTSKASPAMRYSCESARCRFLPVFLARTIVAIPSLVLPHFALHLLCPNRTAPVDLETQALARPRAPAPVSPPQGRRLFRATHNRSYPLTRSLAESLAGQSFADFLRSTVLIH